MREIRFDGNIRGTQGVGSTNNVNKGVSVKKSGFNMANALKRFAGVGQITNPSYSSNVSVPAQLATNFENVPAKYIPNKGQEQFNPTDADYQKMAYLDEIQEKAYTEA